MFARREETEGCGQVALVLLPQLVYPPCGQGPIGLAGNNSMPLRSSVSKGAWWGGKGRAMVRVLLAALYAVAGVLHLALPAPFLSITPRWVPAAPAVIVLTGVAELAGAAALLQSWSPRLRQAAGWALALYALCVWPANANHLLIDLQRPNHGLGLAYHLPRLAFQPVLIWAALWASGAFPFKRD